MKRRRAIDRETKKEKVGERETACQVCPSADLIIKEHRGEGAQGALWRGQEENAHKANARVS